MIWLLLSSALASPVEPWGGGWSELSGAGVFSPASVKGGVVHHSSHVVDQMFSSSICVP